LVVQSSDGHEVAVRVQVNMHRNEIAKAALSSIARRLLLERAEIEAVLESWSHTQLVEHLQKHTKAQLVSQLCSAFAASL
jgi:hypothetical protein